MRKEILFSEDAGGGSSAGRDRSNSTAALSLREAWAILLEDGRPIEAAAEQRSPGPSVGDVYLGIVRRILPGIQAAFIDIGQEPGIFLHVSDIPLPASSLAGPHERCSLRITDLLSEGQRVVVQILKQAMTRKEARGSLQVSLAGRFLVHTPSQQHVGVSRRLIDPQERERLRRIVSAIVRREEGFIIRTAAVGRSAEDLSIEAGLLQQEWEEIRAAAGAAKGPTRLRREQDLLGRVLRDLVDDDLSSMVIEGAEAFTRSQKYIGQYAPSLLPRLRRYAGRRPLLEESGVRDEIDSALKPRIRLRSGGTIVITRTEALVAVDVNTERFVGEDGAADAGSAGERAAPFPRGRSAGKTALATNLEAAREIVRQLRLRDLGGIVVIDFIDMEDGSSRLALTETLRHELERDRARSRVLEMSEFGLVQLTRERSALPLDRALLDDCPACAGSGSMKSAAALLQEIRRALHGRAERSASRVRLRVHPSVEERFRREGLDRALRAEFSSLIALEAHASVAFDRFELDFE